MIAIEAFPLEQKNMLGVFLRVTPLVFLGILERIPMSFALLAVRGYTFGLVESSGDDFTVYQLDGPAR